jgi:class 3 adenylate cyclase
VTEPAAPIEASSPDLVQAGRKALARHGWQEAFDLLERADRETALTGPALEALAEAAFFAGRSDVRVEVKERAYAAYLAAGDPVRAAYVGLDVANENGLRGRVSIASAWARRAEGLLDGQPETYAHAYLALMRSAMAKASGDVASAVGLASEAVAIATRTGHPDLRAAALTDLATLKIATGEAGEGFALLEEAAIAAVNGELSPIAAGITSCQMIAACRDLTDYQRAREWLEATDRWCERAEVSGFPGICRVHRAEILALQGGWERAEQELRKATNELAAYEAIPPMADGLYAIGELRRLQGDLEGAEEALRQAHALGRTPQPALALIRLGSGKVGSAAAAIESALAETSWDQWARARLLAAQVEIALAADDVERARAAVDEIGAIVEPYPLPALKGGRLQALGRVLLAEGDGPGAARELRAAIRSWREVGAPYEVARVRAVLARALRAVGDEDDAELELRAARDDFERLGAGPDLALAEAELAEIAGRRGRSAQVRMTFMFTDIVGSTNLAEALGDEAWEQLLAWHDETLRGQIARNGGQVVNSTGDGFFVAFATARQAVACAIVIQRALAEHRRTSGFAPQVRIGLHAAEATQHGADYSGVGVHLAARVAALAGSGEILASTETLAEAGERPRSDVREVAVKGVSAPIGVATVSWA